MLDEDTQTYPRLPAPPQDAGRHMSRGPRHQGQCGVQGRHAQPRRGIRPLPTVLHGEWQGRGWARGGGASAGAGDDPRLRHDGKPRALGRGARATAASTRFTVPTFKAAAATAAAAAGDTAASIGTAGTSFTTF